MNKLYVVTAVSNTERYNSRYKLYLDFAERCQDAGAVLYTIEAAFGNRDYVVTEANNKQHLQLRTKSQIWHKENMINLGIAILPRDWQYVAWIDSDVLFARPDWVNETIQQLQHFKVVQLFSHMLDLGPDYAPAPPYYKGTPVSFGYGIANNLLIPDSYEESLYHMHPGFAWATTRETFDQLGGLIDWAIVGGADYLMALSLSYCKDLPTGLANSNCTGKLEEWKNRCDSYVKGNVGYVPGLLLHNWHGRKVQRQYKKRWKIITDNNFDPDTDLKRDWQGLWQLTDYKHKLRNDIRNYFRSRNEDSIDVT